MKVWEGNKLVGVGICFMFILILFVLSLNGYAVQDDNGDEKFISPVNLYPRVEELAGIGTQIEKNRDQYLRERGWELGQSTANPGGAYIGWGVGGIKLEPDDVRYGQDRIAAFKRAYADAKGDFARFRELEITTEMGRIYFFDPFPEIEQEMSEITALQERISIFTEKAVDLGEAHLDRLLVEVGVDLEKYDKADKSERKKIFSDSISQEVTGSAISSLSGVRVLANFEDLNSVGVLIIYNEQSEQLARQIARGDMISRRPSDVVTRTILEQLEAQFKNEEDYIPVHGLRIMEDETGEKVLVAFGQWSPAITKNTGSTIREAHVGAARRMARSNAMGELANFIDSTLVLDAFGNFRESQELIRDITDNRSRGKEMESFVIGERVEEIVNQYGRAKLEGITTVRKWAANDPKTGHVIIGHVAMWSPATRDAALGIVTTQEEEMPEGEIKYDEEVRESPPLDHLDPTLRQ